RVDNSPASSASACAAKSRGRRFWKHVPQEQINGCTTLHGEDVVFEHIGRDIQQQANNVGVMFIHEDSGLKGFHRSADSSSVWRCRSVPDTVPAPHPRR